ncbi:hypothetical protein [Kineococcus sp. NPDC059986]|uniref:hypothetical protein n=1 Tax=Kineococcus sp. NPDC059986 TaxID=3155538 RepID=UPI00344E097F
MGHVLWVVFSGTCALGFSGGGLFAVFAAPTAARWNDTKGPAWVRNYNGTAYPGRTKPWHMRLGGGLLTLTGLVFCVIFYFAITGQL